jgi:hypothetical protein
MSAASKACQQLVKAAATLPLYCGVRGELPATFWMEDEQGCHGDYGIYQEYVENSEGIRL